MDADPTWPFERYQAYEDVRFQQSLAEQEQARSSGLVADPKSQPSKQSNQPRPLTWAFAWGWQASNLRPSDYESLALTD